MGRLTKEIKEAIIRNGIAAAGIPAKKQAIIERRKAFAESLRIDALGGIEEANRAEKIQEEIKKLTNSAPKNIIESYGGTLRMDYEIVANIGGLRYRAYFSGLTRYEREKNIYRITPSHHTVMADSFLASEFSHIENESNCIDAEELNISACIKATVNTVKTIKRLLEIWPEAKELLPDSTETKAAQLPAIRREDLNAMIGLPK